MGVVTEGLLGEEMQLGLGLVRTTDSEEQQPPPA